MRARDGASSPLPRRRSSRRTAAKRPEIRYAVALRAEKRGAIAGYKIALASRRCSASFGRTGPSRHDVRVHAAAFAGDGARGRPPRLIEFEIASRRPARGGRAVTFGAPQRRSLGDAGHRARRRSPKDCGELQRIPSSSSPTTPGTRAQSAIPSRTESNPPRCGAPPSTAPGGRGQRRRRDGPSIQFRGLTLTTWPRTAGAPSRRRRHAIIPSATQARRLREVFDRRVGRSRARVD